LIPEFARAGRWFLESGIQEPNGGVARYHHTDQNRNAAISTEITGYSVSALVYFYRLTGETSYLDAARRAAGYLVSNAWDDSSSTMPFEPLDAAGRGYTYFFDCGIILRGLLALWRVHGDAALFDRARQIALSMAFDFVGDGCFHPILELPEKTPLPHEPRWSRSPGCYQLKSALAWKDVAQAAGESGPLSLWRQMLAYSIAASESFLPGEEDPARVMDRLHAYCYFLEALLAEPREPAAREALIAGIDRVSGLLREIRPRFERSDVNAQLLRVRLLTTRFGIAPLNEIEARDEAASIASFQRPDGGFWFGRRQGEFLPFSNPVSTAFCAQALAMWSGVETPLSELI
jgi:hypothetical protein